LVTWTPREGWSTDLRSVPASPHATVALAFADPTIDTSEALQQLRGQVPAAVIGCSTAGQILGPRVDPAALVVAITRFDTARVVGAFAPVDGRTAHDVGAAIGRELAGAAAGEHIAGVMVFAGGLTINGSALVDGLLRHLPPGTPVSGGLAADGPRFEHTWVHFDGQAGEDCVAAFAVIGQAVRFEHGSQGGWDGFGPRRTITASEGNVLYELDGQPALALYKQYLGDRSDELPSAALLFPLTVWSDNASSALVRTVLSVDEQTQSMTFAGDVPQGWSARLMWTSHERLTEGATEAAQACNRQPPQLAVAVSCVGRRLVMGTRAEEEVEAVLEVLGRNAPLIGFYSYGEIAPKEGVCSLHNQTMTITTISEQIPTP
jgi:hypothetical protein